MPSSHMQVWAGLFCAEAMGGPHLSPCLPNRLKSLPDPCVHGASLAALS